MGAIDESRAVNGASSGGVERIDGEAGLARTRYAGDAGEGAERDAGGHVLKIVGARIVNGELLARSLAALCGQWHLPRAVQVIGGKEFGRASCRERVCRYVYTPVVAHTLTKTTTT